MTLSTRHVDLLIRRARIDDDAPLTDIVIDAGRIAALATDWDGTASDEINAAGRAVVPGFIEPHIHLDKAMWHRARPSVAGTLEEAIRVTGELKARRNRKDMLERARRVLDMAVRNGTTAMRTHPDVDPIQHLLGVETMLELRESYRDLIDLQIVAFPQEGLIKAPGTLQLMEEALRLGADVAGGCPYNEVNRADTEAHIDTVFALAQRFDVDIDLHADFADDTTDARFFATQYIAHKTIDTGYQGRVSLGHVTSLGSLPPAQLAPVIEALAEARIHIVTLPATDLYLGGRRDTENPRRGLTPLHALTEGGVNVAYSSNNVRNAFTPFGNADVLTVGNLLAHVAQFGTPSQQAQILAMGTVNAARSIGIGDDYGIAPGRLADLVVLDTQWIADALLDMPPRAWVIKRGRITVTTRHCCEIHRAHSTEEV
ncbi:amidohydrolase family protein [Paraburkholderia saeva]|uniref:Cytosine deaminase n=1 Tax=Paraburkholderia saeva TaxID=2777537 RepID=A0A9N8S036_9BURK|nr:amidohydrolase family protein [Paraburkholderia saeva]CAG4898588.1 Cytosine deaminase [Paraburkholderia saeva]CAG4911277.1 Cytosine deaminase [Paraburkholderia saeva]